MCYIFEENWKDGINNDNNIKTDFSTKKHGKHIGIAGEEGVVLLVSFY